MTCLIEAFFSDDFPEHTRLIPYDLRSTGAEVPYRCCIYMERAILKNRLIADLGFPIEDDDEFYQIHVVILFQPDSENCKFSGTVWNEDIAENIFDFIRKSDAFAYAKSRPYSKIEIYMDET